MTIQQIQDQIIKEMSSLEDWIEKYDYIIQAGKTLVSCEKSLLNEENVINGCQAKVWVHTEVVDQKVIFKGHSEAQITKGILALLFRVFENQTAVDINSADLYFLDKVGLNSNLSPARVNGLHSIVKRIKSLTR